MCHSYTLFCCHLSIATEGGEGDQIGLERVASNTDNLGMGGEIFVHDIV